MQRMIPTLSGLLLLSFAATVRGQGYPVVGSQPMSISIYDHASTAAEGYLRGAADLERADGQWLLNYSQACVNMGEAHRRGIENHATSVRSWFQLREENRLRRAAERRPLNVSPGQAYTTKPIKKAAPAQAASVHLDDDGRLEWPAVLRSRAFATDRGQVEAVLARWFGGKHLSLADRETLQAARGSMLVELKSQIQLLPTPDYLAAVKCINTLTGPDATSVASGELAAE